MVDWDLVITEIPLIYDIYIIQLGSNLNQHHGHFTILYHLIIVIHWSHPHSILQRTGWSDIPVQVWFQTHECSADGHPYLPANWGVGIMSAGCLWWRIMDNIWLCDIVPCSCNERRKVRRWSHYFQFLTLLILVVTSINPHALRRMLLAYVGRTRCWFGCCLWGLCTVSMFIALTIFLTQIYDALFELHLDLR